MMDFEGLEVSPAPPPTTESELLAESLFDFECGEDIFLAPVLLPEPVSLLPVPPSVPLPLSLQSISDTIFLGGGFSIYIYIYI